MVARQETRVCSNNLPCYHIFQTAALRLSTESFNVISHIIVLRTLDCEFAFNKCNKFCEMGTLETLDSENSDFKEKDVQKTHPFCT